MKDDNKKEVRRWRQLGVYLSDSEVTELAQITGKKGLDISQLVNRYLRLILNGEKDVDTEKRNFVRFLFTDNKYICRALEMAAINLDDYMDDEKAYEDAQNRIDSIGNELLSAYKTWARTGGIQASCSIECWDDFYDWYYDYRGLMK